MMRHGDGADMTALGRSKEDVQARALDKWWWQHSPGGIFRHIEGGAEHTHATECTLGPRSAFDDDVLVASGLDRSVVPNHERKVDCLNQSQRGCDFLHPVPRFREQDRQERQLP